MGRKNGLTASVIAGRIILTFMNAILRTTGLLEVQRMTGHQTEGLLSLFVPMTTMETARVRMPSNSTRKMLCQRPSCSSPPTMLTVSEVPK